MIRGETPGHDEAFRREALAHADALYNLGRYLTRNPDEAEDLVQETYARALRGAAGFRPGTNLKAWLFAILRNQFLSSRRGARRTQAGEALERGDELPSDDGYLRGDLELERMRRLVSEEIEAALLSLSDEARTVVLLDLEDLSEGEVAQVMGCAVGTVKSRLARARAALRERLSHYAREGTR
jgi:RNA polymerase sigma-70 factor (ECF subfamily)